MPSKKSLLIALECLLFFFGVCALLYFRGFTFFGLLLNEAEQPPPFHRPLPDVTFVDAIVGNNAPAGEKNQKVAISYIARLEDNTIFETVTPEAPLYFTIGAGEVIHGLEQGVKGMQIGGLRIITIPPELGYGEVGKPGLVPPNATLVYEVQLHRIREAPHDVGDVSAPGTALP